MAIQLDNHKETKIFTVFIRNKLIGQHIFQKTLRLTQVDNRKPLLSYIYLSVCLCGPIYFCQNTQKLNLNPQQSLTKHWNFTSNMHS